MVPSGAGCQTSGEERVSVGLGKAEPRYEEVDFSQSLQQPRQVRTEQGRKDQRGADLSQIHPNSVNCQLQSDPPAGQTLNTAK